MTVLEMINKVLLGELTELDKRKLIKEFTEGFKTELLKKIEADVIIHELYLGEKCKKLIDDLSEKEQQEYVDRLIESDRGWGLNSKAGCFIYKNEKKYNLVALMYPQKYMRLRLFQIYITELIVFESKKINQGSTKQVKVEKNRSNFEPNKPIYWSKGMESLRLLLEELISNCLIESRDTEEIIEEHFYVDAQHPIKQNPQPIIWIDNLALLAYMIESLDGKYIKPNNLWGDTMPHFLNNSKTPENMRQIASGYKNNKTGKPKGFQIIDDIIGKLII